MGTLSVLDLALALIAASLILLRLANMLGRRLVERSKVYPPPDE